MIAGITAREARAMDARIFGLHVTVSSTTGAPSMYANLKFHIELLAMQYQMIKRKQKGFDISMGIKLYNLLALTQIQILQTDFHTFS